MNPTYSKPNFPSSSPEKTNSRHTSGSQSLSTSGSFSFASPNTTKQDIDQWHDKGVSDVKKYCNPTKKA